MALHLDDFKAQVDELDRAQRHLRQSMDASGIGIRRALELTEDSATPQIAATKLPEQDEHWPRGVASPSSPPFHPRVAAAVVVALIVLVGVAISGRRPELRPAATASKTPAAASPAPAPATLTTPPMLTPASEAPAGESFTIRVSAIRPCRARVIVDGTPLDWREMREGDEFVSSSVHDILIDASDAGALAATVNGRRVRLGADGAAASFHLNSQNLPQVLGQ